MTDVAERIPSKWMRKPLNPLQAAIVAWIPDLVCSVFHSPLEIPTKLHSFIWPRGALCPRIRITAVLLFCSMICITIPSRICEVYYLVTPEAVGGSGTLRWKASWFPPLGSTCCQMGPLGMTRLQRLLSAGFSQQSMLTWVFTWTALRGRHGHYDRNMGLGTCFPDWLLW